MFLIDTHCHIQFEQYDADRDDVIDQCKKKDIGLLIVGCEYESSEKAIALTKRIGSNAWCAIGQHPTEHTGTFEYNQFEKLLTTSKSIVAIGETGLDYFRIPDNVDREKYKSVQREVFSAHIDLAQKHDLPLIIHCRDAHDDMITILQERFGRWKEGDKERGVLHCFTGNADNAARYLELGFFISFTGIITFATQYDDVVRSVPLEKILIETDSPFLTPTPFRGKRNSPLYVEHIASRISELKGTTLDEISGQTTENAQRLFAFEMT